MNDVEVGEVLLEGGEDVEEDDDLQRDQFYCDFISFNDCMFEIFVWFVFSGFIEDYEIDFYEFV